MARKTTKKQIRQMVRTHVYFPVERLGDINEAMRKYKFEREAYAVNNQGTVCRAAWKVLKKDPRTGRAAYIGHYATTRADLWALWLQD